MIFSTIFISMELIGAQMFAQLFEMIFAAIYILMKLIGAQDETEADVCRAVMQQVKILSTAFLGFEQLYIFSQVPQPLLLVVGWVYSTLKTCKFFFAAFHSFHLVMHWEKLIKIG